MHTESMELLGKYSKIVLFYFKYSRSRRETEDDRYIKLILKKWKSNFWNWKALISEMMKTLEGIDSRLGSVEGKISELEGIAMETAQNKT